TDLQVREKRHAEAAADLDAKAKLLQQRDHELTRRESELGRLDSEAQAASKALRERERELARGEKEAEDKARAAEGRALEARRELKGQEDALGKLRGDVEGRAKELKEQTQALQAALSALDAGRGEGPSLPRGPGLGPRTGDRGLANRLGRVREGVRAETGGHPERDHGTRERANPPRPSRARIE